MTAKAKQTKKQENASNSRDSSTVEIHQGDEVVNVDIIRIHPSPLEPQLRRRERFTNEELGEMVSSIKKFGLINPITIRPSADGFEIVAGERRWMASQMAGVQKIKVFIKNLSNEDALELQLLENLQRKDVHPLDEANWFKHLMEIPDMTVGEIALKVGKTESYVLNRLKFKNLIKEVEDDLNIGTITLTHALEIAKYSPDAQTMIYEQLYHTSWDSNQGKHVPDKTKLKHLGLIKEFISKNVLYLLAKAPFSKKATNLRADKLPCVKCPERTGANVGLFEADQIGKNDACLNPTCYRLKVWTHIEHLRQAVAEAENISLDEVPVVDYDQYENDEDGKYIGRRHFKEINTKNEPVCEFLRPALSIANNSFGKTITVCLVNTVCTVHHYQNRSISQAADPVAQADKQREERLIRKEELFDVRVGAMVRQSVLKYAAENFTGFASTEPELLRAMVHRLWLMQRSYNSDVCEAIAPIIAVYFKVDTGRYALNAVGTAMDTKLENLQHSDVCKIAFLLLKGHLSPMFYFAEAGRGSSSYSSQKNIRELAEQFDVDYLLIDAQERLEQSSAKHKEKFRDYLTKLENGDATAKLPRLYSEKWKPKD